MAFNLDHQAPLDLLGDYRGAYESGEVLSYREWHEAFIFERLLNIYRAHGMRVHTLTPSNTKKGIKATPFNKHLKNLEEDNRSLRDSEGEQSISFVHGKLFLLTLDLIEPRPWLILLDSINRNHLLKLVHGMVVVLWRWPWLHLKM